MNYKVYQIGCGKMSVYTIKYALEKGFNLVGACDINPDIIGKSIKDVLSIDNDIVISNIDKLKEDLITLKPDVAIVTTMSLISDLDTVLTTCAECGVNAITTCEEAFYPEVSNPVITEKLDKLCKENNCTITGSGYQDVFWGNLIYTLGGATHKIEKIKGSSSYNVEDYGIALAIAHGAGFDLDKFDSEIASVDKISDEEREKLIQEGKFLPSYMWNVVPWLADRFGYHLISLKQKCVPIVAEEDIYSDTLKMNVSAGTARGMSAIVTGTTEEGVIIEAECIGKVYTKEEVDTNEWTIIGEPTTSIVVSQPDTVKLTCASIVNRIPDVINSIPGYVPTSKMGEIEYIK